MRQCDGCMSCCINPRVPELNKPERVVCKHCDKGCSIYETRPPSCRKFECMWMQGHFREEDKPNKSGVMIEDYKTFVFAMCDGNEWKTMATEFDKLVASGIPVVIGTKTSTFAGLPIGMTQGQVNSLIKGALNGST